MSLIKAKTNLALTSATEAVANLCEDAFSKVISRSEFEALRVHSATKQGNIESKSAVFYRSFFALRAQMIALLADTYRQYIKLALAHPSETGHDANRWAWIQLQPAIHATIEWICDWYVLASEGENRHLVTIATVQVVPGQTVTTPIQFPDASVPPAPWRAPAWLFGVSLVFFGIGMLKTSHVPNKESSERLDLGHSRLLLKGSKRIFVWELQKAIERVRNEEIAAAGAVRTETANAPARRPNKRRGWEQRLKLYGVMQKILSDNHGLQGMDFCAELDKRHALPLLDWMKGGEWREGLTWKEAWNQPQLRSRIRRVRQEAQKRS